MMKSKRLIVPFLKNIIQTLILEILIKQNIQKNLKKSKMRIKPLWMKEKEVLNNKAMVVKQRERVVINIKEMIRKLTKKLTVLFKVDVIKKL